MKIENIKKYLADNKYRIIFVTLLAMAEMILFVYPIGLGYYYKKLLVIIIFATWLGGVVRIPQKAQLVAGIFLLLATPPVLVVWLEKMAQGMTLITKEAVLYNVLIALIIECILVLFTLSARVSVWIVSILLTLLYTVNYFVYLYRGRAFSFHDIWAADTAFQVVGNYDFTPTNIMVVAWSFMLLAVVWAAGIKWKLPEKINGRKMVALRAGSVGAGVLALVIASNVLINVSFWEKRGMIVDDGFSGLFYFNGYLVSACIEGAYSGVEKPENYSTEEAENILAEYANVDFKEQTPHIIVIMNESMADLRVWGNLELSEECMPFYDGLKENTVRGYVNASVLGGGTANTEFEVLMGASMALLPPIYYPYQQCIEPNMESMVSILETQGYTTYSIHPENSQNWNRKTAYERLGFDAGFWLEDFEGAPVVNSGVADSATYDKIIELYESREENKPLFIFDVTMQNHGGYTWTEVEHEIKAENLNYKDLNNYLSLLRQSDEDFEELIHYFTNVDEKVIICMFGDHQPKFDNTQSYDIICAQTPELTEADKIMNLYKTPFVIWANYDIEEKADLDISMNYLGLEIMNVAQTDTSPYFRYLNTLMKEYPIITVNGFYNREYQYFSWKEEKGDFDTYRILQYYQLFDTASRNK